MVYPCTQSIHQTVPTLYLFELCNPIVQRLQPTGDFCALGSAPPMSSRHRNLEPLGRWHATIYIHRGKVNWLSQLLCVWIMGSLAHHIILSERPRVVQGLPKNLRCYNTYWFLNQMVVWSAVIFSLLWGNHISCLKLYFDWLCQIWFVSTLTIPQIFMISWHCHDIEKESKFKQKKTYWLNAPSHTLKTGITLGNGSSIPNLLQEIFHSQIKIKYLTKMYDSKRNVG